MTIVLLLVGLGLIVLGADWLVDGASGIARRAGALFLSSFLLRLDRWEGALMLAVFAAWYVYLFNKL